ncbi:hypothetical protein FUAX_29380 [Fulvitalea axinellae]|uniref:HTH LytTR-type domain-containing protein n=1 Tax=Fulvitalea axinellae TaxID=1182444 RepID=A0AAU9CEF6_9BACT|nr:hypothetical protein FUAX_29380 [Fulvitalea axinellae]
MKVLSFPNGEKLKVRSEKGTMLLRLDELVYVRSDGRYSNLFMLERKPILVSESLKVIEELLTPYLFVRCHKCCLINLAFLEGYSQSALKVHLRGGKEEYIPASKSGLILLRDALRVFESSG